MGYIKSLINRYKALNNVDRFDVKLAAVVLMVVAALFSYGGWIGYAEGGISGLFMGLGITALILIVICLAGAAMTRGGTGSYA